MKKETVEKLAVAVVLCFVAVVFQPAKPADALYRHVWWIFYHANVWHLAGNLFVLWCMTGRLWLWPSVAMTVAASWLPVVPGVWEMWDSLAKPASAVVTLGFSGVLFAMAGVKWGVAIKGGRVTWWTFCKKVVPVVLLGALVPHVNWSIHGYCLMMGVAYGRWR